MKIGLVTIYQVPNFGSVLQTYATQTVIEKMGYSCNVINYRYPNELQSCESQGLRSFLYRMLICFGITAQQRKIKKLKKFIRHNLHLTKRYNSYGELKADDWSSYDVMIVGSDQVWHTDYTKSEPAFLLQFLPDNIKRISIASSFASQKLDENYKLIFRQELQKFSYISVREKSGLEIINSLGLKNKNPVVCLDPTLLLPKEEWCKLVTTRRRSPKYILLYMWTYAFDPRPYIFDVVRYYKDKLGDCQIVALEGFCNIPHDIRKALGIVGAEDSSISEFIDFFCNAKLVITSSFHGTAFAINFGVPLVSIVPRIVEDDRQSSFLMSVNANKSIVKIGQKLETIDPYYDKQNAQYRLSDLRNRSIKIIEGMLKNVKMRA